jgi:two-component system sensor histidine kinase/response regulator
MRELIPSQFTILMVDDNPKNLQLLGSTLRNEGYQLEFATSGNTALSWLEKRTFDLILLDIMMPEMTGFEVCEQIRKQEKHNDLSIIFLTAKTEKESILKGFNLGAQDYITKPFDTAELLARVRTHLELRYSREVLKNMNQILEEKVEARTTELQKTLNELILANEKLLILDKAKSEFLHIISHEIRTPLNGIKGSLEIIRETAKESSVSNLFNILDASVCRLEKFSLLALKITQLKIGKYELDLQSIPCTLLMRTVLSRYEQQIAQKIIKLQYTPAPEEDTICCDFEMFSLCLASIVDNAIKFTPKNSTIIIQQLTSDDYKTIEIIDEGPGFTKKALDNLFNLFSVGEKHVNENEGLELALTKLIIDAHSGIIKVENLEKGAKVSISIPANPEIIEKYY